MKKILWLVAALVFVAGSASATVVNPLGGGNGSELNMQQILNNVTQGGVSSVNAYSDFLDDSIDSLWTTGGVGISSATMILEIAGWAGTNTFGIYDSSDMTNKAVLFSGAASAGHKVALTFGDYGADNLLVTDMTDFTFTKYNFGSQTFGFYLNDFYSDSSLNTDSQFDHMVAYGSKGDYVKLPGATEYTPWMANEFILAFEDTFNGGDHDYNDMVLMVESVSPVPEPGTLLLLGSGLIGLAFLKRRKQA